MRERAFTKTELLSSVLAQFSADFVSGRTLIRNENKINYSQFDDHVIFLIMKRE